MNITDAALCGLLGFCLGAMVILPVGLSAEKSGVESDCTKSGVYKLEHKVEGRSKAIYCYPVTVEEKPQKSYLDVYAKVGVGQEEVLVATVEVEK